jgi:hypothetical protein
MEKIPYFSNSKLRKYREFADENSNERLCESLLFAYLRKQITYPSTEAMRAGRYFEEQAGFAPLQTTPDTTKAGKLTALFERAEQQGLLAFNTYRHIWTGAVERQYEFHINLDTENGTEEVMGFMDFVNFENDIIFDVKFSGLLNNKYEGFARPSLFETGHDAGQAKTYSLAYYMINSRIPTFEFHVWSQSKVGDAKIFRHKYTAEVLLQHKARLIAEIQAIRAMEAMPEQFRENFPALHRCVECPLRETCNSVNLYPEVITC